MESREYTYLEKRPMVFLRKVQIRMERGNLWKACFQKKQQLMHGDFQLVRMNWKRCLKRPVSHNINMMKMEK